jgi:rubrerythrin
MPQCLYLTALSCWAKAKHLLSGELRKADSSPAAQNDIVTQAPSREGGIMAARETEEIVIEGDDVEVMFNRTGVMINPEMSAEMIQGAKNFEPSLGDGTELAEERADYISEGLPIGSYPPISSGDDTAGLDKMAVLLDKLGERLAFERQGARLYETFIHKVEATGRGDDNGPTVDELRHICDEELEHFHLLQKAITELGGDATAMTPSADVAAVISQGVVKVACDPRMTIAQTLQAVLTAELADNDGWQMLQQLAAELGQNDLEKQCEKALEQEQEHLQNVRSWLATTTLDEALAFEDAEEVEAAATGAAKDEKERPSRSRAKRSSKSKSSSGRRKKKK